MNRLEVFEVNHKNDEEASGSLILALISYRFLAFQKTLIIEISIESSFSLSNAGLICSFIAIKTPFKLLSIN